MPHEHAEICGYCQKSPPAFEHSYCLFHYRYPVDKLIVQLKFNGQLSQGRLLGQLLGEYIRDNPTGHDLPDAIIPMPLHPSRLKLRGFNQAAELARVSSRILEIPLAHHVCRRIKNTPPQLGLDAKTRRRNLRNAFWVDPDIRFSTVAIVDDVMTTGSSMRALANALVKAGAQRVELWCIARTAIDS